MCEPFDDQDAVYSDSACTQVISIEFKDDIFTPSSPEGFKRVNGATIRVYWSEQEGWCEVK